MKKISIKKFVEGYNNRANEALRKQYIKDNLDITPYAPFVKKDALITNLLKTTMFDKDTGNVRVNSSAEYLLKTRILIENYTNLTVETEGFFEEYDELKKSGLFNILLIGDGEKDIPPMIPIEEIAEFNHLLEIKRGDVYTNKYEIHSFITEQVDRFKALGEATLTPFINALNDKLDNLSKEDIEEIARNLKKNDFKEV